MYRVCVYVHIMEHLSLYGEDHIKHAYSTAMRLHEDRDRPFEKEAPYNMSSYL